MAVSYEQTKNDVLSRSQTMLNQAIGRGTTMLADRVEHYTNLAREVGDILRERGEPQAADVAIALSERVQSVARYLRSTEGPQLFNDMQDALRGRSWLLTGAGFVGGLAIARAVRTGAEYASSSTDTQSEYTETYSQTEGRYTDSSYAEQYSQ